jgi:hypothetical protein
MPPEPVHNTLRTEMLNLLLQAVDLIELSRENYVQIKARAYGPVIACCTLALLRSRHRPPRCSQLVTAASDTQGMMRQHSLGPVDIARQIRCCDLLIGPSLVYSNPNAATKVSSMMMNASPMTMSA